MNHREQRTRLLTYDAGMVGLVAMFLIVPPVMGNASIDKLDFLAGHWRAKRGTGVMDEIWMPPSGGTMSGMSRTVREGKTTFTEFFQVSEVESKITMRLIQKIGSPAIDFKAIVGDNEVTFVSTNDPNKATVKYQRSKDNLTAVVQGEREGQPYKIEFQFEKVK